MSKNEPRIREKFENILLDGLAGVPLVGKDGPVIDPTTGEVVMGPPDNGFLAVVKGYLKDLMGLKPAKAEETLPATGKSSGMLERFERQMPFGARPN